MTRAAGSHNISHGHIKAHTPRSRHVSTDITNGTPTNAFGNLARHLCGYHPPADQETADRLGEIRDAYKDLIERIEFLLPDATPETTLAARAIHDACQRSIAAVILNQQTTGQTAPTGAPQPLRRSPRGQNRGDAA